MIRNIDNAISRNPPSNAICPELYHTTCAALAALGRIDRARLAGWLQAMSLEWPFDTHLLRRWVEQGQHRLGRELLALVAWCVTEVRDEEADVDVRRRSAYPQVLFKVGQAMPCQMYGYTAVVLS